MSGGPREDAQSLRGRPRSPAVIALSDGAFYVVFAVIGATYVLLIVSMLLADVFYMSGETWRAVRRSVAEEQFIKLDRDADGLLTREEFAAANGTTHTPEVFAALDADSDGEVSQPEFQEAAPELRFQMLDTDQDRVLTPAEFGRQVGVGAIAGTDPLFRRLDRDGDREITLEEFKSPRQPVLTALVENPITTALADRKIRYSIWLSLISCTLSAILSVWVAVPTGYLLARHRLPGRNLVDAILDIPIVLPPLVVGLSLLIMFQFPPFNWVARHIVYQIPAVVLAQFSVACAFAVRTMKATFDHINPRCEQVALSLGCTRLEAFGWVVLPEAKRGMMTAFTLAWARSLGEFGPLLIFAGATRMKTEVLSTTVYLEVNVGDIAAAVAVSLIMVAAAALVLSVARIWGSRELAL
jgi:molybdate transport system permease protein